MSFPDPRPHQTKAIDGVLAAIAAGHRRICLQMPTGAGKTFAMAKIADRYLRSRVMVSLYAHRKLLIEQLSSVMTGYGLPHGIRAAGYKDDMEKDFQISSIQTEHARAMHKEGGKLHLSSIVFCDEGHLNTGDMAKAIFDRHLAEGASAVIMATATPVSMSGVCDVLVQAGVNSELRACGALVAASHFGPDEPDLRGIKQELGQDLTEEMNTKAIMRTGVFGRVLDNYRLLNPENKPTILFAPGVAESIWFAEEFEKAGISAAHIDGDSVIVNGKTYSSSRSARQDVLDGSKDGSIKVVSNRFCLREGIDAPWLQHGIFATVFGSLQSYIQSGGRLLRAAPGKAGCCIQDHGAGWWRHGSLNDDRHWSLDDTDANLAAKRESAILSGKLKEPCRCPKCTKIGPPGKYCHHCGHDMTGERKTRMVVQTDGTLKPMEGDVYKAKVVDQRPEAEKEWTKCYYRARNAGFTFRQAESLFAHENYGKYPSREFKLMPKREVDWFRKVSDVSRADLN